MIDISKLSRFLIYFHLFLGSFFKFVIGNCIELIVNIILQLIFMGLYIYRDYYIV